MYTKKYNQDLINTFCIHFLSDSDAELSSNGGKLELNSKHITVHQTSEEESDNEGRRTASLGDLSKLEFTTCPSGPRSNNGTLERAQSLEMSDPINQVIAGKATPKKRKAPLSDPTDTTDFKEPRLSDAANLDTLQRGRLKSAYEWGNLEDAIYDGKKENGNVSDTESIENETIRSKLSSSSMDMMTEVLAAADKFDKEVQDIDLNEVINVVTKTEIIDNNDVVKKEIKHEAFVVNWDPKETENKIANAIKLNTAEQLNQNIDETRKFIEIESRNGVMHGEKPTNGMAYSPEPISIDDADHLSHNNQIHNVETITISPVQFQINNNESAEPDAQQIDSDSKLEIHDSDQIKIINYGSNMPDDVKVTRIPFGSLERPKSEVFKKLIAEQISVDDHHQHTKVPNGISTTKIVLDDDGNDIETTTTTTTTSVSSYTENGPISLTLGGHMESDLTESSQISPVFSSDGHGVNSISISSTESNIRPESRKDVLNVDNIVTISTEGSQPSSIIMIDDENLNFTLQTINDDALPAISPPAIAAKPPASSMTLSNIPQSLPQPHPRASKDEVIIIESLSSKKVLQDKLQPLPRSNGDISPPPKNFVTEIRLQNSRQDNKQIGNTDADQMNNINNNNQQQTHVTNILETNANATQLNNIHTNKSVIVEEEYIPRNSEIKFTTSTYESPPRHFEKRHSHIDQIRSNFERNHSSEIPVPIRKSAPAGTTTPTSPISTSTSNARTSPSKIPVFHSQKSSENLLKNNGNVNKVSVTVTSIKNSSRNPSGK